MTDTVTASSASPLVANAQDAGDYIWRAAPSGILELTAHAFPPAVPGRFPPPAACGIRWTAAYGLQGERMCRECVAQLRDQLRAIVVALAAAGINVGVSSALDGYENRPGGLRAAVDYDAPVGAGESVEASRG
jgi:hypothetical protein